MTLWYNCGIMHDLAVKLTLVLLPLLSDNGNLALACILIPVLSRFISPPDTLTIVGRPMQAHEQSQPSEREGWMIVYDMSIIKIVGMSAFCVYLCRRSCERALPSSLND